MNPILIQTMSMMMMATVQNIELMLEEVAKMQFYI